MTGVHPTQNQALQIVDAGIEDAGGFKGSHALEQTLSDSGLATSRQRGDFQISLDQAARERNFKLDDIDSVPNDAGTTVKEVRDHVQSHATAREVNE